MLSPSFSGKSGKVKGGGLDLTLSAEAGFDCFRRRDCCSSSSWGGDDMGVGCTANDGEGGRWGSPGILIKGARVIKPIGNEARKRFNHFFTH